MKKKASIIHVFLSLAVLFAIVLQNVHAYEHHFQKNTVQLIKSNTSTSKSTINDSHDFVEKCSLCDFHFSTFTAINFSAIEYFTATTTVYSVAFYHQLFPSVFNGSFFSLRAPPSF
ncbi:hypothetical protein [Flavobacterium sp. 7A]|uniref:hypothetical protein n=1 Tax=Flavobacterium sp. 7A TaxID=2940571 RepID=UPI002226FDFA|nr:hypothetical protein [Flavobacterium sp. 7A]MCW2119310.1 hypothetical protein [Flavobacterium sp. 7A]